MDKIYRYLFNPHRRRLNFRTGNGGYSLITCDGNSTTPIRNILAVALLGAAAVLASCTHPGGSARTIEEEPPSVTYEYSGDQGLIDAMFKAEEYCRQFNAWPAAAVDDPETSGEVTFFCEQERIVREETRQSPTLPSQPTASYSYQDAQGLIDATNQAQRHCAKYGARARTLELTRGGGSNTVVFECVR